MDEGALSRLESFLMPDGEARMRFREGLLRKTIYEGLAYRLRVRLHREAGEAMERLAEDPEDIADSLAMHFSIAGDHERTWRYGRLAAERAAAAYSNVDAARLFRIALDAARKLSATPGREHSEAWSRLGNVSWFAGMFEEALKAYREAYRLAEGAPEEQARLRVMRAAAHERRSQFAKAMRELALGRRLLRNVDSEGARQCLSRIQARVAVIRLAQDRYKDALREAEKAETLARASGERAALADALVAAGSAEFALGRNGSARMEEALSLYQALGDLSNEGSVRCNLGVGAYMEGRWDDALEWFRGYQDTAKRAGNVANAAHAGSNLGEMLVRRGELDEAMPVLRDVVRVMRASGFADGAAFAEIQIGRLLLQRGDYAGALELLERVTIELRQLGKAASALEAACVQVEAMAFLGQGTAALDVLDTAARAAGANARMFQAQIAAARVQALVSAGRTEEALRALQVGLESARRDGMQYEEALLLAYRAESARRRGKGPDAMDVAALEKILASLGIKSVPRLAAPAC
jgi:tetratricopeptide (TPR) repeat protein